MYRITGRGYSELIEAAFSLLPSHLFKELEYTHFLTGCNPNWVGLHDYVTDLDGPLGKNRTYANTAHACFPEHTKDKTFTIVIPSLISLSDLIHELGHILDRHLGEYFSADPVCKYAHYNEGEAFACAFESCFFRFSDCIVPQAETRTFFEELLRRQICWV